MDSYALRVDIFFQRNGLTIFDNSTKVALPALDKLGGSCA